MLKFVRIILVSLLIIHSSVFAQVNCELPFVPVKSLSGSRDLSEISELRIGSYNVLNLEHSVGKYKTNEETGKRVFTPNKLTKDPEDTKEIAAIIKSEELDIVILQEVEGKEALNLFNKNYLDDEYEAIVLPGNDQRGIDVAFLVKKDLPIKYKYKSNRDRQYHNPNSGENEVLFSRDVPSLHIWKDGSSTAESPQLVLLGNHLKSQRDRANDPKSIFLRTKQVDEITEIVKEYEEYYPNSTVLLGGDFNANLINGPEFQSLKKSGLMSDTLDVANPNIKPEDRITHSFHPRGGKTSYSQMDGIFVNKKGKEYIRSARVYRYKVNGEVKPLPKTYKERETNPSDHFPVIITVDSNIFK